MKALDEAFERATLEIAHSLWPKGWRVWPAEFKSVGELTAYYNANGRIAVSSLHCDKTVFSTPEVNHAFRAWHDWHHIRLNAGFDRDGEMAVHAAMRFDLTKWALKGGAFSVWEMPVPYALLQCENIGQLDYWERFGVPPDDQRTFACGYLAARGLL